MTTPSGYVPLNMEAHRQDTVALWRGKFGDTANVASDTPDGLLIDLLAIIRTRYGQSLAEVYANGYFGSSVGLHLDNILALLASKRKQPAGSVVEAVMFGALGTVVPSGAIINSNAGDAFASIAQETIGATNFVVFQFGPADVAPTVPEIQIAGFSYTAAAALGTGLQIAEALTSSGNPSGLPYGAGPPHHGEDDRIARWWTAYEDPAGNGTIVVELKASAPFAAFASESDAFQWAGDPALFRTEQDGRFQAEPLEITAIGSSQPGWEGVANLEAATPGRVDETDPEYRLRHVREVGALGKATPRSLAAALRKLTGVEFARVYMNTTGSVDGAGRPGHSFEPVVEGGAADEIALTTWNHHTTGTRSVGQVSVVINDPKNGELRTLFHSRPTKRYLWIDVDVLPGEGFPTTPIADLQADTSARILAWGQTKGVGFDIYLDETRQQVSIPGTAAITIRFGTTAAPGDPKPGMSVADLTVGELELARFDGNRIAVVVL